MNDKTEQTVTDALRLVASSISAAIDAAKGESNA